MRSKYPGFAVPLLLASTVSLAQGTPKPSVAPAPATPPARVRSVTPRARPSIAPRADAVFGFDPEMRRPLLALAPEAILAMNQIRDMRVDLKNIAPMIASLNTIDLDRPLLAFDLSAAPRAPWAAGDPADSLYRLARESLNSGEYRRAAQLFATITEKYPKSQYANDAKYWRAFALYRIGGVADLHEALRVLDSVRSDTTRWHASFTARADAIHAAEIATTATAAVRASESDVRFAESAIAAQRALAPLSRTVTINFSRPTAEAALLAMRIRGALAARGDATAAAQIARTADGNALGCDDEAAQLRIEALNALVQMDPKTSEPTVIKVLARRDSCSAQLRRGALGLVARTGDSHSVDVLISTADNDPDLGVRSEAVSLLGRSTDARSTAALSRLATSANNPALRRIAVRALAAQGTPAARQSIRDIMSRADTPADVRLTALHYAGKTDVSIADLARIYSSASDRSTRSEVISLLAQRDDPQAADRLAEIAKTSTDPSLRAMAIDALSRRKDPRTAKLLMDIVDK